MSSPNSDQMKVNWEWKRLAFAGILGLLIVIFFGFTPEFADPRIRWVAYYLYLDPPPKGKLEVWQCWEIGALLCSLLISQVFYWRKPIISRDLKIWKVRGNSAKIYFPLLFLMAAFHWVGARTLFDDHPGLHIVCLIAIGLLFAAIDLFYGHFEKEKSERIEAMQSLLFADVPIIIAFLLFWLFWFMNRQDTDTKIFLSGAISFQFIAATFTFVSIDSGLLKKAQDWVREQEKRPD